MESTTDMFSTFVNEMTYYVTLFIVGIFVIGIIVLIVFFIMKFLKHRKREEISLDTVLLQIALPKDNEIKIDAAEQMFASLAALQKDGLNALFNQQPHISFEIVGKKEDIRFYIAVPRSFQDQVEKQIFGAYPGAEVKEVDEYNIFSQEGKVAFNTLKLSNGNYYPIKVYKDLATDPLSSITSALAKMGEGEGCAIQIIISPAAGGWNKAGRSYISKTKKK